MTKILIGPKLRQIRRQHNQTQAQMANRLGVSPAYVNLLENNQRSLSVQLLMALADGYGIDARSLVHSEEMSQLSELRAAARDPGFPGDPPDLQELRAAIDHAPQLVQRFLALYRNYRGLSDEVQRRADIGTGNNTIAATPEQEIYEVFRNRQNHFAELEHGADDLRRRLGGSHDNMYAMLRRYLRVEHSIDAEVKQPSEMPDTLRSFDEHGRTVQLSAALDHPNRVFQLAHVLTRIEMGDTIVKIRNQSHVSTDNARSRLEVELTNYAAAAVLLPYAPFLEIAEQSAYDIDQLVCAFGASHEQVCQRLTTLQREGARGIPWFFLRVDRAGNVIKRVNPTGGALAEKGGGCPVWNIHAAFQTPGMILPQFVELPEGERFFTIARTSDRPVLSPTSQDRRVVVVLGCEAAHAEKITYTRSYDATDPALHAEIGISCHLCPRQKCAQRAHQPLHISLPVDANRRGKTRYES